MHTSQLVAALAGLSTLVAAAPAVIPKKSFTVSQVTTGKRVVKNGATAYAKALNKFKAPVPAHVAAAAGSGSVTATPEGGDAEYVCPVTVGSQSQTLNLDFDTGSADLWVTSDELPSDEQSGHTIWQTGSGAQKLDGYSWSISYGDGSGASGDVYQGDVTIGGVTASNQAIEAASSLTASQSQPTPFSGSDGLVGLAFSKINTVQPQQQTTFFDTVKGSLDQQVFTADLKAGAAGSYDFGTIDSSKYSGDITYVSVDNSQGFWGFSVDSTSSGSGFSGIADTGTTLVLVDDDTVSGYYSQISSAQNSQSAGGYVFDCNDSAPDWTVTVGGTDFTVPGSYINFAAVGDGTCYGGIQSNSGIGFSIMGDIFLKSVFVVFDGGNNQLGIANKA